jgi:dTDP-4-dehydrorhamnose 3,5-epimerase
MKFRELSLPGAFLIDLDRIEDSRGFFARTFCEREFRDRRLNTTWVQSNNSFSKHAGTLRGLHFQVTPYAEVKLVRCIRGAVWDVLVDLRDNSETYGEWCAAELSEENRSMMYVPRGFAHGFVSLCDRSELIYLVSALYSPESERTLHWNDPFHGIRWPVSPTLISDKDNTAPFWISSNAIRVKI